MGTVDYSHLSERELEKIQSDIGKWNSQLRVFIADILPKLCCKRENVEDRMIELESLVTTFGGVVILEHLQKRGIPDYNTYIGSGKLDEIAYEMHLQNANLLIIGDILKPHQINKINQKLKKIWAVAWDRVDLILKIFEKNARTTESKLQIELAAIKHMGPRIFDMGMELGKQSGKGSGETNTEIMKRHLARREAEIKKTLAMYAKVRKNHRQWRKKKGYITVGIVGYTNAGKSSLMNALTKKWVLAENKLFATLWTSVGKMWIAPSMSSWVENEGSIGRGKISQNNTQNMDSSVVPPSEWHSYKYQKGTEVLLSDTIGFIRDLPPELIDAFTSTLEDSIESDILFHVVDASDEKIDEKIQVVDDILDRIEAHQKRIYIFNKIDALSASRLADIQVRFQDKNPLFVSAHYRRGLQQIEDMLREYVL